MAHLTDCSIGFVDDVVLSNRAIIIVAFLLKKTFRIFFGSISFGNVVSARSSYQRTFFTWFYFFNFVFDLLDVFYLGVFYDDHGESPGSKFIYHNVLTLDCLQ